MGVAWPFVRSTFGLPLDALGLLLAVATAGYAAAGALSSRLTARLGVGTLLAWSCLTTAVSLLGYAVAPAWWAVVACALLTGAGGGAIDAGINQYAARRFTRRGVTWLHASFGTGAAMGPAIMTTTIAAGYGWQAGYALVAFGQLILAGIFAWARRAWSGPEEDAGTVAEAQSGDAASRSRLAAVLSVSLFFAYTGLESATGQWSFTFLTAGRGVEMREAGLWVSAFWLGLTAGRVLLGLIADTVPATRLIRASLAGGMVGLAAVALAPVAWLAELGLAVAGFSYAAVFPMLIASTPTRFGASQSAAVIGWQVSAAAIGYALVPGLVGVLAERLGVMSIGLALLTGWVATIVLFEAGEWRAPTVPTATGID